MEQGVRISWAVLASFFLFAGCAQGPTRPRPTFQAGPARGERKIVHCFDGIEHLKGSTPVLLGGTCAHSPTLATLSLYHRDGLLLDYDLDRLKQLYSDQGIKTIHDHRECNNYCPWGPHVVKGGRCLVPPTAGTKNYEEVLYGLTDRPPPKLAWQGSLNVSTPMAYLLKE